jgi:hypothetical protein
MTNAALQGGGSTLFRFAGFNAKRLKPQRTSSTAAKDAETGNAQMARYHAALNRAKAATAC